MPFLCFHTTHHVSVSFFHASGNHTVNTEAYFKYLLSAFYEVLTTWA